MHQQDAHELLRHLTEGIRTEEVKRQKSAILKHFKLSEKTGWQFNMLKFSLEKPLEFWLEFWLDSTEEKGPF